MDGLGELFGAPRAAAEFAEDVPGLELGRRARRVNAVARGRGGGFLTFACVTPWLP